MWFQLGVLSRISKAEFDRERPEARTGAIAELDWVRAELEGGRNPATGKRVAHTGYESLVRLAFPSTCPDHRTDTPRRPQPNLSDLSHFHTLNRLLDEVDARRRAAEAVRPSLVSLCALAQGLISCVGAARRQGQPDGGGSRRRREPGHRRGERASSLPFIRLLPRPVRLALTARRLLRAASCRRGGRQGALVDAQA